jgi:hypothetical protein
MKVLTISNFNLSVYKINEDDHFEQEQLLALPIVYRFANSFPSKTHAFRGLSNFAPHPYLRPDASFASLFEIPSKISLFLRKSNFQILSKAFKSIKNCSSHLSLYAKNLVQKIAAVFQRILQYTGKIQKSPCCHKVKLNLDQILENIEKLLEDDRATPKEIFKQFELLPKEDKEEIYRKIFIGKAAGTPLIHDPLDKDHRFGENFFKFCTKDPLVKAAIHVHRNEKRRH